MSCPSAPSNLKNFQRRYLNDHSSKIEALNAKKENSSIRMGLEPTVFATGKQRCDILASNF
jgi:hypothetical protein